MRTYDCNHKFPEQLERELVFNEVMKLRHLIGNAEVLLDDIIETKELTDSLKKRIEVFLNGSKKP